MSRRVWKTTSGKEIPIEGMADDHLENAIAWCQRNEGLVRSWGMQRYNIPRHKALGEVRIRARILDDPFGRRLNALVETETVYEGALPLAFVYEPYSWLLHERSLRRKHGTATVSD